MHPYEYAEKVDQNEKNMIIKKLNDHLYKIIDKSKTKNYRTRKKINRSKRNERENRKRNERNEKLEKELKGKNKKLKN